MRLTVRLEERDVDITDDGAEEDVCRQSRQIRPAVDELPPEGGARHFEVEPEHERLSFVADTRQCGIGLAYPVSRRRDQTYKHSHGAFGECITKRALCGRITKIARSNREPRDNSTHAHSR